MKCIDTPALEQRRELSACERTWVGNVAVREEQKFVAGV